MTTRAKTLLGVLVAGVVVLFIVFGFAATDAWDGGMHGDDRGGHMEMMDGIDHSQMMSQMGDVDDETLARMRGHMADYEQMMSFDQMMDQMMTDRDRDHHAGMSGLR